MENKKINFTKLEYKLVSVKFNIDYDDNSEIDLKINDELIFESIDGQILNMAYHRELLFNDVNKCGLKTSFRIIATLDEDAQKHFSNDIDKIKKFVIKNEEGISNSTKAGADASLIIAQLTIKLPFGPIVLPPYFIRDKNE